MPLKKHDKAIAVIVLITNVLVADNAIVELGPEAFPRDV
jgi:hypothetical protein